MDNRQIGSWRELAGLARSPTAPRAGLSEMHDSRPHPLRRDVTTGTQVGMRRAAPCGGAVAGLGNCRFCWARCEMLVLPPGPGDEHVPSPRKATIRWSLWGPRNGTTG